jgi:hypothetical protein
MTTTPARPTRRTLVRSAAWSVPVVSLAAAAPAFAASCATSYAFRLDWGTTPYSKNTSTNIGSATVAGPAGSVPISVNFASTFSNTPDRRATDNLTVPSATNIGGTGPGERGLLISHSSVGNTRDTRQTVVISFTRPVTELAFKITDVDSVNNSWFDRVELSGPRNGTYNSTYVTGNGTNGNAWRPTAETSPVDITSPNGNVSVLYTAAVSTITLEFYSTESGSNQLIRLTDLTFKAKNC